MLISSQFGLSAIGQSIDTDQENFKIIAEPSSTTEKAVINVSVLNNAMDRVELSLSEDAKVNIEATKELAGDNVTITYDKENYKVILNRVDDQPIVDTKIVLTNLIETNKLHIRGIIDGEMTNTQEYVFTVDKVIAANDETSTRSEDEQKNEDVKTSEPESNKESIENEREKQDSEKSMNGNEEDSAATNEITPFSGNLNVDIDISPVKNKVLAGNDAAYNLVLKVTGSRSEFTNAKIIVDLPIKEFTNFTQDVSELIIDGVTPTYDETSHQLIYEFDSIKPGRSYETLIKVNTENGLSPNNADLAAQASFTADNQSEITDDATVSIDASSAVSVSKKFKEARLSGEVKKAPFPNSYTIWDIKVSIPKKDVGQMFIKEGSKIVIKDTFSNGLTFYDVMNDTPQPTVSGRTLTWEIDAPTFEQQMEADSEFFTMDLRVRLRVNNDESLIGTTQENNVSTSVTFIDDQVKTDAAKDSITIVSTEQANGDIEGTWYVPTHVGPLNGNGGIASNDLKNPNPDVYDDAYLGFSHGIAPLNESEYGDFQNYTTIFRIDSNLILDKITTPGRFEYRPNSNFPSGIPLAEQPRYNIVASVNGVERVLVEDAENNREYTRGDLGLSETERVDYIKYDFTYAPSGMLNIGRPNYYFEVQKGYTGEVVNTFNVYGRDANGGSFDYRYHQESRDTIAGPRSATIVPKPTDQPPIGQVGVELLTHDGGEVIRGENRMKVRLANSSSSTLTMSEPLETVVLLPIGVTINEDPKASYTDTDGMTSNGDFEILNENFNGSGRQLVKIMWNDDRIRIGRNLTAELDVTISDNAPNTLQFDVYGFSGDEELRAPAANGDSITDTVLQTDEGDLNGDGITDQPRLKSGNIYMIRGQYDIQTEKLVKGELDDEFTYFGHTTPSGSIDYQVKLTNTTGQDITKLTLIDVLPSEGDLGITDNVDRGSQFTPKMTNSIVLPTDWQDKVNVYYSEAKNPERDDLTKNTVYPDSTTKLTNPAGAEAPNWKTADDVSDWSSIHSFKIELKDGVEWIKGQDLIIQFSMQAPSETEVPRELLDSTVDPTSRAAWNSFAIATDHGQPVEPLRVGVYMDYDIEDPEVEKTVNDQKDPVELIDLEEQFTWKVDYTFGNYTADWESVSFSDQIHELLDIEDVQVVNQDGEDVTANGELDITDNLVTFTLNKQDGSFSYLKGQIYTLIIESKIKSSATAEELEPFIQSGGIPNTAELIVNDDPTTSNEVKIRPPISVDLNIIKLDKLTRETLQGAEFELWKCPEENSELDECTRISTKSSDEDGVLTFTELQVGSYKLVETKAPEDYRILKQPIPIEIDGEERQVEIEVENSKNDWELPKTGGIGTLIFYLIGATLMYSAAFMLIRRKKNLD